MNQQEFEPRGRWNEGRPKDEPAGAYGAPENQESYQHYQPGRQGSTQVPWWARPQPQQWNSSRFAGVVTLAILVIVLLGALGIAGAILGSLANLLGIILGAIFAFFLFIVVLVLLIFLIVRRAISRATRRPRGNRWY